MKKQIAYILIIAGLIAPSAFSAPEAPLNFDFKAVEAALNNAPEMPEELDHGMTLRLIDFIDCTNPDDPHEFMDLGTSKVVEGPAGKCRVTAGHRHAFFAYRHKSAGKDKPIFIVVEYPDDAQRIFQFVTHDAARHEGHHNSFALESGSYTGEPLPLSNKMQYFTFISWSQDEWPPLAIMNLMRKGGNGAASRIWVYAIDEMPPLEIAAPKADEQRNMEIFFPLSFCPRRDYFGWSSPHAIDHMVDYFKYVGVNRTHMIVWANKAWSSSCIIPSWGRSDDDGHLDKFLSTLDRKGGVELIAGIVTPGMYGKLEYKGKDCLQMDKDELREAIFTGLNEFIDHYGKYKSLKGIALGSMETIGFYEMLNRKGLVKEVVEHIREKRPDFEVVAYFGNAYLQAPYFKEGYGPTPDTIIEGWQKSEMSCSDFLGKRVMDIWKKEGHSTTINAPMNHDPDFTRTISGLKVYEMVHPDDHRVHLQYTFQPRSHIYYDVARSQNLSDRAALDSAAIFSSFNEAHAGLLAGENYWYSNLWMGPDVNPTADLALASYAQVMAQRDRLDIAAGTWGVKTFGIETQVRQFSKAFRELPPVVMNDVKTMPVDFIKVRWVVYEGSRYISLQNKTPFPVEVSVDVKGRTLKPYELAVLRDSATAEPKIEAPSSAAYCSFIQGRIGDYKTAYDELKAVDAGAVKGRFAEVAEKAQKELAAGKLYAADVTLGFGLFKELQLRKSILQPPRVRVPRIEASPLKAKTLDAWPDAAADIRVDQAENLIGHVFFPNKWSGPEDLSARVRLAHDGKKLYFGIEVFDDVADPDDKYDACQFLFSAEKYLAYESNNEKWDMDWKIVGVPGKGVAAGKMAYTVKKTDTGYLILSSIALDDLDIGNDHRTGFRLAIGDRDNVPEMLAYQRVNGNVVPKKWALKQTLAFPHIPTFRGWDDARTAGELVFE